jgi:hypothetical protein
VAIQSCEERWTHLKVPNSRKEMEFAMIQIIRAIFWQGGKHFSKRGDFPWFLGKIR